LAVLADLNNALAAIATGNSGNAAPSVTYPYLEWNDTLNGLRKIRDGANSGWITIGALGAANLGLASLAGATFTGPVVLPTGSTVAGYAALAGATFTGPVVVPSLNGGPLAGFRNKLINGSFYIWQNGTTFTSSEYGADQWIHGRVGTTHTVTRQQFTVGQTAVPGEPEFFCRTVVSSVSGASNYSHLQQRIEGVRTYAGQQVTFRIWAMANATKSIAIECVQNFGTGGSPSAEVTSIGVTKTSIGTSWQSVPVTVTLPSISGKTIGTNNNDYLALIIWLDAGSTFNSRTSTLGQQSGTFDIAQVQMEPGSLATPFEQRPIGVELALCQRYFEVGTSGLTGYAAAGVGVGAHVSYAVTKRAVPTLVVTPFNYTNASGSGISNSTIYGFMPFGTTTVTGGVIVYGNWTASARL
jgi:hypothetical protein